MASSRNNRWVLVGRIGAAYGIHGWVRVRSFTEPEQNIGRYRPWRLSRGGEVRDVDVVEVKPHGKGLVARLKEVGDRNAAGALTGMDVLVCRDRFDPPADGEYYWDDLIGLQVSTVDGRALGEVVRLLATGANDVLVVRGDRQRLIPFVPGSAVVSVDLDAGRILVDWDPEF